MLVLSPLVATPWSDAPTRAELAPERMAIKDAEHINRAVALHRRLRAPGR